MFTFVVKSQEMTAVKIKSWRLSFFRLVYYHLASFVGILLGNGRAPFFRVSGGYDHALSGIERVRVFHVNIFRASGSKVRVSSIVSGINTNQV